MKEVAYHADIAADWVVRLGDGTEESRRRMLAGLDWCWRFVDELFQMDAVETRLASAGVAVDRAGLRPGFDARVAAVLEKEALPAPVYPRAVVVGRVGHNS